MRSLKHICEGLCQSIDKPIIQPQNDHTPKP